MGTLLDISSDFENVCNDFFETATLKVYGQGDVRLTQVMSEPRTWRELDPTNAQVIRQGTEFIWAKKRSDQPPLGSVIVDDSGEYWTIWRFVNKQHVETWEAICLNLSIMAGPNYGNPNQNLATVLVASYEKGRSNESRAVWRGLFTGKVPAETDPDATDSAGQSFTDTLVARFQPLRELSQIQFSSEFPNEQYRVYFEKPWPRELTGGNYRLVSPDGSRFRVIEYITENRIDRLPVALATRIIEGSESSPTPNYGP